MNFKSLLVSTAALAAFAVVVPAAAPVGWNPIAPAQAQNASFSFAVFYDGLATHGDWVSLNGAYVFVPANVDRHWRPYTVGHWVYTSQYGWMWASDEPFGWATYHYGRWGFAEEIGWYWVPGSRWAPAWVSWRTSGSHVVWAPLPPSGDDGDISISVSVNSIPDYYWVAVPAQQFLSVNLSVVIVDNDRERRRIVNETEFRGAVRVDNDVVVNNVIEVDFVREKTGEDVREVKVKRTDKPDQIRTSGKEVAVFTGNIEPEKDKKPRKVKKIEEVKQNNRVDETQQKLGDETGSITKPEEKTEQAPGDDQPVVKERGEAGQQADKPAKKKERIEQTEDQPDSGQGQQVKPQKKKQTETAPESNEERMQGQPDQEQMQPPPEEGQPEQQRSGKKGEKKDCDPATNPECPPQQ